MRGSLLASLVAPRLPRVLLAFRRRFFLRPAAGGPTIIDLRTTAGLSRWKGSSSGSGSGSGSTNCSMLNSACRALSSFCAAGRRRPDVVGLDAEFDRPTTRRNPRGAEIGRGPRHPVGLPRRCIDSTPLIARDPTTNALNATHRLAGGDVAISHSRRRWRRRHGLPTAMPRAMR